MEIGAVDADYQLVFAKVVAPILLQFEPDLVIVSAGFDAHERDPLGGMRLTTPAFAAMTRELRAVADECCRGRIVSVTEGGYDLQALAASLDAVIAQHAASAESAAWPPSSVASSRGEATVTQLRPILAPFWTI
jgi:acetoin utilization deacetylase AcuC-like enzyme